MAVNDFLSMTVCAMADKNTDFVTRFATGADHFLEREEPEFSDPSIITTIEQLLDFLMKFENVFRVDVVGNRAMAMLAIPDPVGSDGDMISTITITLVPFRKKKILAGRLRDFGAVESQLPAQPFHTTIESVDGQRSICSVRPTEGQLFNDWLEKKKRTLDFSAGSFRLSDLRGWLRLLWEAEMLDESGFGPDESDIFFTRLALFVLSVIPQNAVDVPQKPQRRIIVDAQDPGQPAGR